MWNSTYFDNSTDVDLETFFRDQLTGYDSHTGYKSKVLAISRSKIDGIYYAAVHRSFVGHDPYTVPAAPESGLVDAVCCEYYFDQYDQSIVHCRELVFRITCESNGPKHTYCDPKILKLLTPTSNPRANEWRNACIQAYKENAPGFFGHKFLERLLPAFKRQHTGFSV